MRIDLPNGHWAELRAPEDVTERQRRPIMRAVRGVRPEIVDQQQAAAALPDVPNPDLPGEEMPGPEKRAALRQLQYDMTNEEADAYQDAGDHAIVALVASWSYQQDVTLDGVLDLPGRALDVLRAKIAPLAARLYVDASPSPETTSPFGPSNGSEPPSEAAQPTTSLTSFAPISSSVSD